MLPEFYEGREICITGGSGNVGKALIEKLLRSCNVGTIYVLLRPKKNATVAERLERLKKDMIFRRLSKEKPSEFEDKIVAVPGDIAEPMMGITYDHLKLMENVAIVIHSAATVRFDEPLRKAIKLNVGGTLEALKFAETLKHLELFMHVSTFYSNPYLEYVEAKCYKSPMDWQTCLDLCRRNDIADEILEGLTKKLVTGFSNTYCFTKNIAESLVNYYRTKLPVAISRPPGIMYAVDDPEPGFPPSLNGAMGLYALSGAGILKAIYASKDHRAEFSAFDTVIKCILYFVVKSVYIYADEIRPSDIPIYNISSCTHSNLTVRDYVHIPVEFGFWKEAALENNFLIPGVIFTDNRFHYLFLVWFKQILPASLVDLLLILMRRKPVMMKVQRKIFVSMEVLKPFLSNMYKSDGITCAQEMINALDGTDFHMDTLRRWNKYNHVVESVRNMAYKVREVLFKEDPATLPRSRRIMQLKIISYRFVQICLAYKLYHIAKTMISNWRRTAEEYVNSTAI